jgi:hypothetical protein
MAWFAAALGLGRFMDWRDPLPTDAANRQYGNDRDVNKSRYLHDEQASTATRQQQATKDEKEQQSECNQTAWHI